MCGEREDLGMPECKRGWHDELNGFPGESFGNIRAQRVYQAMGIKEDNSIFLI
jgi:hypothetical protein